MAITITLDNTQKRAVSLMCYVNILQQLIDEDDVDTYFTNEEAQQSTALLESFSQIEDSEELDAAVAEYCVAEIKKVLAM